MARDRKSVLKVQGVYQDDASASLRKMGEQFGATLGDIEKNTRKSSTAATEFNNKLSLLKQGFGTLTKVMSQTVGQFAKFEKAIAEVSTLVDDASHNMGQITVASQKFATSFGTSQVDQAKAFYQSISAGAADTATAIAQVEAANKLALGGVTDVTSALDGLSSIMNAYGLSAQDTADVSDAFFVAMKKGKTTVGELSENMGRIAPIANAAGMSLDEMFAAVSAVTTGGIKTDEAVIGVRQAISGILNPTKEAKAEAERLGIQFDKTALKTKGLAGVLDDIKNASGKTDETMGALFGNIRAQVAVLALMSNEGSKFTEILGAMEKKSGATGVAVDKMSQTTEFAMQRAGAAVENFQSVWGALLTDVTGGGSVVGGFTQMVNDLALVIQNEKGVFNGFLRTLQGITGALLGLGDDAIMNAAEGIRASQNEVKAADTAVGKLAERYKDAFIEAESLRDALQLGFFESTEEAIQLQQQIGSLEDQMQNYLDRSNELVRVKEGENNQTVLLTRAQEALKKELEETSKVQTKVTDKTLEQVAAEKRLTESIEKRRKEAQRAAARAAKEAVRESERVKQELANTISGLQDMAASAESSEDLFLKRQQTFRANLANFKVGLGTQEDAQKKFFDGTDESFLGLSEEADGAALQIAGAFTTAFATAAFNARNFGEVFSQVIKSLAAQLLASGLLTLISSIAKGAFNPIGLLGAFFNQGGVAKFNQGSHGAIPHFAAAGVVPGVDQGRDSRLAFVRPQEEVLTPLESRSVRQLLARQIDDNRGGNGRSVNVSLNVSGVSGGANSAETQRWLMDDVVPNLMELIRLNMVNLNG